MRLAVIMPIGDQPLGGPQVLPRLAELREWRRHGHRVILVNGATAGAGASGDSTDWADPARCLADRVVYAPSGWSRQVNAGSRAPEVELADALVFLPPGVRLPPGADRRIARALANSASPWGRFDIGYDPGRGRARWPLELAAAVANAASRLTGICTRDQAVFVARGAFLALQGYAPVDPRADRAADDGADAEFCRRARLLGRPITLRERALVPAPARDLLPLAGAVWRRERARLAGALGLRAPH